MIFNIIKENLYYLELSIRKLLFRVPNKYKLYYKSGVLSKSALFWYIEFGEGEDSKRVIDSMTIKIKEEKQMEFTKEEIEIIAEGIIPLAAKKGKAVTKLLGRFVTYEIHEESEQMKYHNKILKKMSIGRMYSLFNDWLNHSDFEKNQSHQTNGILALSEKNTIKHLWKKFYEYLKESKKYKEE